MRKMSKINERKCNAAKHHVCENILQIQINSHNYYQSEDMYVNCET